MQAQKILRVFKPSVNGLKRRIISYTKKLPWFKPLKSTDSQVQLKSLSKIKENIASLVSQSPFLSSETGRAGCQKFIKNTGGDYRLLCSLLENKELCENNENLQHILHITNTNNAAILKKYLSGKLQYAGKEQLQNVTRSQLNCLLALNRNNTKAEELISNPKSLTGFFSRVLETGKGLTSDLTEQNQIMQVMTTGSLNGKGCAATLGENLLNDFENVVHNKPYYKKFGSEPLKKIASKVKIGEAFSIKGKMYIKENDGSVVPLNYDEKVFERLFPPIERFNICQGKAGDCFFLSPLNSIMETPLGRNEIYKMFSGSTESQIILTTSRFPKDRFLFKELEQTGYAMRNKTGLAIIEQYQALGDYGEGDLPSIVAKDCNMQYVMRQFAGISALGDCIGEYRILPQAMKKGVLKAKNIEELESLLKYFSNEPNSAITFGTKQGKILQKEADLVGGHVYCIKGYNPDTKTVSISNPWHGGIETILQLRDLAKHVNFPSLSLISFV